MHDVEATVQELSVAGERGQSSGLGSEANRQCFSSNRERLFSKGLKTGETGDAGGEDSRAQALWVGYASRS